MRSVALPDLLRSNRGIVAAYGIALALFVVGVLHSPGYASDTNVRTLLLYAAAIGIAAFGQTLCILTGGIDLSLPWTMTGAAVLTAVLAQGDPGRLPWIFALLIVLAVLVGLLNGAGVAYAGVPPILMTLGSHGVLASLVLVYTRGGMSARPPEIMHEWVTSTLLGIPAPVIVWVLIIVLATVMLSRGTIGRRLYAIGTNRSAALLAGVNIRRTLLVPYIVSALSGGLAGLLLMAINKQAFLSLGQPYLFATAAAVAVGGASILGGSGHYLGTVAGALILTLMASLLTLFSLGHAWLNIGYGLILLLALLIATPQSKRV